MIERATAPELRQRLDARLHETRNQVARLEQVFRVHDAEPKEMTCPAIDGIVKAGDGMTGDTAGPQAPDGVIASAVRTGLR